MQADFEQLPERWWALLFGLSMLARYEPAGWMKELDYDSSDLAPPREQR